MNKTDNEVKNNLENNQNNFKKAEMLIEVSNFLFSQVKLQQEVRDRWFGHYLTIVGAVLAFSTLLIKLFESTVTYEILFAISSSIFALTSILGFIFYILYLCQRSNYRKHYKLLEIIQVELVEKCLKKSYRVFYPFHSPFAKNKHGADFYTLLIQNIISSFCIGVSVALMMFSLHVPIIPSIIVSLLMAFVMAIVLFTIFKLKEKKHSGT